MNEVWVVMAAADDEGEDVQPDSVWQLEEEAEEYGTPTLGHVRRRPTAAAYAARPLVTSDPAGTILLGASGVRLYLPARPGYALTTPF